MTDRTWNDRPRQDADGNPIPPPLTGHGLTNRRCPECGRLFDLDNPDDVSELVYGHDCEAQTDDGQMIAAYDHEYEPPLLGAVAIDHTGPLYCRRCGEDHRA